MGIRVYTERSISVIGGMVIFVGYRGVFRSVGTRLIGCECGEKLV